jgi:hypothetical protein
MALPLTTATDKVCAFFDPSVVLHVGLWSMIWRDREVKQLKLHPSTARKLYYKCIFD